MYEILIELASNGMARAIIFDQDEAGVRTVRDIIEAEPARMHKVIGQIHDLNDMVLIEHYDDFDFGRAKRLDTKIKKIIEGLVNDAGEESLG